MCLWLAVAGLEHHAYTPASTLVLHRILMWLLTLTTGRSVKRTALSPRVRWAGPASRVRAGRGDWIDKAVLRESTFVEIGY